MTIGTTLFNTLFLKSSARLDEEISALQLQISSGKNDLRPSTDLLRAVELSALRDRSADLDRFESGLHTVQDRLSNTDTVMSSVHTALTRLQELSLQAASDTTSASDKLIIRSEALELRATLVSLANSKDATGRNLFGGYRANGEVFSQDASGAIVYSGDRGIHSLRVSESMTLQSGIYGATVFMDIDTGAGPLSLFDVVDGFIAGLGGEMAAGATRADATDAARLGLTVTNTPAAWSFTLQGPDGSADIAVVLIDDVPGPMIDAINASSGETGITAQLDADGTSILLSTSAGGQISLTGLQTAASMGDAKPQYLDVQPLDASGVETGQSVRMLDQRFGMSAAVANISDAADHVALAQASAGALAGTANAQAERLTDRRLNLDIALAGLEDADLARAVTQLQALLLNRQASQAAFARISQQSLFDYLQ